MAYRLQRFFFWNWVLSLAVLAVWFIYAALRDGPAVHRDFLGLTDHGRGHTWPPWVFIFFNEALVLAWYFLPSKAHSGTIRGMATVFGLIGLAAVLLTPVVLSQPLTVSLELTISIYVFASILGYAIFWPSDEAI